MDEDFIKNNPELFKFEEIDDWNFAALSTFLLTFIVVFAVVFLIGKIVLS